MPTVLEGIHPIMFAHFGIVSEIKIKVLLEDFILTALQSQGKLFRLHEKFHFKSVTLLAFCGVMWMSYRFSECFWTYSWCSGSQLQANGHFHWKAVLIHLLIYLQVTCFISRNNSCGGSPLSSTKL